MWALTLHCLTEPLLVATLSESSSPLQVLFAKATASIATVIATSSGLPSSFAG